LEIIELEQERGGRMIQIGVTGWGDHDILYKERTSSKRKLSIYSTYFPIVELDASYYSL
jgi:uncharacterized protein YecE (DUF72 family)